MTHIEIHVHGTSEICQKCCVEIKESVFNAFKVKPQLGFVCPCRKACCSLHICNTASKEYVLLKKSPANIPYIFLL